MSSRSLNEILIKIPTELFNFIFAAYNLRFIVPRVVCLQLYVKGRCTQNLTALFYLLFYIFVIPALRKRRVQGQCTTYHFRMSIIDWVLTSQSICLQTLYSHLKFLTYNISLITAQILIKQKREKVI